MSEPTQILAGPRVRTVSGNKGLQIEEPLIFEQGMQGRSGVDLPAVPQHKDRLGNLKRKGEIGRASCRERV